VNKESHTPEKPIAGNATKYESYHKAWSLIRSAQENEFFLEAITIQESIISDRLISYLSRPNAPKPLLKNKNGLYPSFGQLIEQWRSEFPQGQHPDLIDTVDNWRHSRNSLIHAIVKSEPGQPTQPINEFLENAEKAAQQGTKLAKDVSYWCRKEKKKKSHAPASPKNADGAC
jgi:hypothetical protein